MKDFVEHVIYALFRSRSKTTQLICMLNQGSLSFIQSMVKQRYIDSPKFGTFWLFYLFHSNHSKLWDNSLPLMNRLEKLPQIDDALEVKLSDHSQSHEILTIDLSAPMNINGEMVDFLVTGESWMNQSDFVFIDYLIVGSKQSALHYLKENGINEHHRTNECFSPAWPNSDAFVKGKNRFIITDESDVEKIVAKYPPWYQIFINHQKMFVFTTEYAFCRTIGIRLTIDDENYSSFDKFLKLGFNVIVLPKKLTILDRFTNHYDYFVSSWRNCFACFNQSFTQLIESI